MMKKPTEWQKRMKALHDECRASPFGAFEVRVFYPGDIRALTSAGNGEEALKAAAAISRWIRERLPQKALCMTCDYEFQCSDEIGAFCVTSVVASQPENMLVAAACDGCAGRHSAKHLMEEVFLYLKSIGMVSEMAPTSRVQ
jgi:hypothetical protein